MNTYRVIKATTNLHETPDHQSQCVSQALYGEHLVEISTEKDWLYIKHQQDNYLGYVHTSMVKRQDEKDVQECCKTVHVHTRHTLLFEKPDIKSRIVKRIPFASRLKIQSSAGGNFYKTIDNTYVWQDHCQAENQKHPLKPVQLAKSHFLGAPYYWGGRSTDGLDCSGLIQLLAQSQSLYLPRDSLDQEHYLTHTVSYNDRYIGDVVYWPGHTGILTDTSNLLHATAHTLSCCIEPLGTVIDRAGKPSSIKRLFS